MPCELQNVSLTFATLSRLHTLTPCSSFQILHAVTGGWWLSSISTISLALLSIAHLTCSATKFVVPDLSTHLPKNNSPRNGFSGFMRFFFPCSSLLLCCSFSVLRNHFSTNRARFSGSGSLAGATKRLGCSAQYAENSTID